MSKLIQVSRALALGAALLLSLSGCGGGSDEPRLPDEPKISDYSTLTGRVADARTGEPLAGVTVQFRSNSAVTGADGKYTIGFLPLREEVVIQFSKPDFAATHATITTSVNTVANRTLARIGVRKELNAATGGVVTMAGSPAQVELPAAGLVTASGTAYTGTVAVEMTPIDPGTSPLSMPGNFRAEGEAVPIESMGALQVELRDSSGAKLNLAPGKTATIRIPVPAGAASPPLTMPLYYFKESTGLWVREGSATLAGSAPSQYYEGTVSHFTVWNADQPIDTIYINGCVVNSSQQPRDASVRSEGLDYFGSSSVETQPVGIFRIAARRNSRVLVSARAGDDESSIAVTTGGADLTLPACLVLDKLAPVIVQQPAGVAIAPGSVATLAVLADHASRYTWYRNGVAIGVGSRTLSLLGYPGSEGNYHVVVSNAHGSATSATASVSVSAGAVLPVITTQPSDVSVLAGATPTFAVQAAGSSLTYQWLRNGVAIASAQGPELTLGAVTGADNGALFAVRVTNGGGSVTSDSARLTVTAEAVPPSITTQPASVSAAVGQNATFAVAASGTGTLSYQWLRNGAPISGATEASYQTAALALADHGAQFSVRVTNAKGSVTSAAASLSVTASSSVPGLHLAFSYGSPVNEQLAYGAIPAAGGTPVPLHAAGQGEALLPLVQASISNGLASNYFVRSMLFWKNGALVRRDLSGPSGLPAEAKVSTITSAGACDAFGGDDFAAIGNDATDALKSWYVVRKQGPDAVCGSDDDLYLAVRANMAAGDAPLEVALPVAAIHSPSGALTGWLLRKGLQMQRVDAAFSNPVTLFTLPSDDASFAEGSELSNHAVFSAGDAVYAIDLVAVAPAGLTRIATLASGEFLDDVEQVNQHEMVLTVGSEAQTRVMRYTIASKSVLAIGTVAGRADLTILTPTRVLMRTSAGALMSFPIAGGAPVTLPGATSLMSSLFTYAGGERIWHEFEGSVVSVNSDASGGQTFAGARLAGCVLKAQTEIWSGRPECEAVLLVNGASLRSHDATSGALRVTYGNLTLPAAPLISYFYLGSLTGWGDSAVLTQVVASPEFATTTVANYLIKTDQPGVTQIVMP